MILVCSIIWNVFMFLFLWKGLEKVFGCVLDRKQAFQDYINNCFRQSPNLIFLNWIGLNWIKGLVHDFGQKFEISSWFVFGKIGLEILFGDVLDRKRFFSDYNNVDFAWSSHWIFPMGLIHDFGQKFEYFLLFLFGQNRVSNSVWWCSG